MTFPIESGAPPKGLLSRTDGRYWVPPSEVAEGVWRIRVPQPRFAANHLYLLTGRVPTLVDSGHAAPEAQDHLDRALDHIGLRRSDLAQVIYTHTHLDHMGGGMTSWTGPGEAAVEHRAAARVSEDGVDLAFDDYTHRLHDWTPWLRALPRHPMVDRLVETREDRTAEWLVIPVGTGRRLSPRALRPGESVDAGDFLLDVVDVRGHDPYHLAFVAPEAAWAITGDVILSTPTPLVPPMDDDAIAYRSAVDRLAAVAPRRVFPAHGPLFDDGPRAIARCAAAFDRMAQGALVTTRALVSSGLPAHPASVLQAMMDADSRLRPPVEAFLGVLLANIHSHLLRHVAQGQLREPEPHRFVPGHS